jgi:hypothetical protein
MSQSLVRPSMTAAVARRGAPRKIVRAVNNAVAEVAGEAIVRATKIEAAAWLTDSALGFVEDLSAQEAQAARLYPQQAHRFSAIVDSFTAIAVNEIRQGL